jgi:hypothetical protein
MLRLRRSAARASIRTGCTAMYTAQMEKIAVTTKRSAMLNQASVGICSDGWKMVASASAWRPSRNLSATVTTRELPSGVVGAARPVGPGGGAGRRASRVAIHTTGSSPSASASTRRNSVENVPEGGVPPGGGSPTACISCQRTRGRGPERDGAVTTSAGRRAYSMMRAAASAAA